MTRKSDDTIFFGLYNSMDFIRFFSHTGPKRIFWCGGDIINLTRNKFHHAICYCLKNYISYCETGIEQDVLKALGIEAKIAPMIFDDVELPVSFMPVENMINVYTTMHRGREEEYGLDLIREAVQIAPDIHFHIYGIFKLKESCPHNLTYHGQLSSDIFDKEIQNYHGALRLNLFDGFSETLAKSFLMGQYPVSYLPAYGAIQTVRDAKEIVSCIRRIKKMKGPNWETMEYWKNVFDDSLTRILNGE